MKMSKMQLFTTMCGKVKYIAVDKRILCWLDESHGSSMVFVNLRYTVYGIRYTVYGIRYYGSVRSGGVEGDPPLEGGACS